jgi:N-terminal domain of (some) glycogen debranching enzymes
MSQNTTNVIDGSTFLISDRYGDARAQSKSRKTDGLFYRDMRYLSTFDLTIRGAPVELLSTNNTNYYAASFFLALDTGSMQRFHRIAEVSVIRHRNLLRVLREEVTLQNHSHREIPIELEIRLAADFADLFEVKEQMIERAGLLERSCDGEAILFTFTRDGFERGTEVEFRVPAAAELGLDCPDDINEPVMATVTFWLPARSEWTLALDIFPYEGDEELEEFHRRHGLIQVRSWLQEDLRRWIEECPRLYSSSDALRRGWATSTARRPTSPSSTPLPPARRPGRPAPYRC